MYRRIGLTCVFAALSACSHFAPAPFQENTTLLIIPKNMDNQTVETWVRTYYLQVDPKGSDGSSTISVRMSNDSAPYQLVEDLSPGEYRVSGISYNLNKGWRSTYHTPKTAPLDIPFTLKAGQATLLDRGFALEQESRGSIIYTDQYFWKTGPETLEEVSKELESSLHGSSWVEHVRIQNVDN